ncbi:uracil-DNA glycosylase, partial [Candidatus Bathyarchaeota archaeon]
MESRIQRLEALRKEVEGCRKCPLWRTRKNPVFGEGPPDAEIMLIGLGPGRQEDLQGRPFVGAAGKFLDQLLEVAGLRREEVYITNVMKCFLPENRATDDEIKTCTQYLDQQIE